MIEQLVLQNRSYRRFDEGNRIGYKVLEGLINLARVCPSSRNVQALKFIPVWQPDVCDAVFATLAWAGYLKDWSGPGVGERPSAYIVILGDTRLYNHFDTDTGIVAQTMLLGAVEQQLGGCMVGSIQRNKLREVLGIADHFEISLVLALGKPTEDVKIVEVAESGDVKYYRDEHGTHYVPKRSIDDITIKFGVD